ncbi:MAG: hypothetical protein IT426_17690 [Pirellulales bacterium]|nr:hypothetical protein [Pirellulales bacterium]
MTAKSSFLRKIYYIIGIAGLLLCLYFVGRPATKGGLAQHSDPGGMLAKFREDPQYGLSQTQLGEIDPAGESIKLATLGLRGVAALVLWEKSNEYKMKEDWAKYEATLNQIAVVQPHFISVWIHLAWNLSYNISVEFDNYRDRYHWVIEGIKYLQKGIENNNNDPRLLWETGWTVSQKIGRADEHLQYRRLFKEDDEFHGARPKALRDNWLVGKTWYDKCIEEAERTGKRVKGKGPLIYNSSPAMCLMNYSEAIEEEGTFGQVAKLAWQNASKAWQAFGRKKIPDPDNNDLYLADLEKREELVKKYAGELDDLDPGLREKIRRKKYEALSQEQKDALKTDLEKRTDKQHSLVSQAEAQMEVTYEEIARQVPLDKRTKAKELAAEALKNEFIAVDIRRSRDVVNYAYWKLRAEVEQEDDAVAARKAIYDGTRLFRREADLIGARDLFNKGFLLWRNVLDKHQALIEDSLTGDDMMDVINVYRDLLHKMGEPFPKPFILQDIVDKYDKKR